MDTLLILFLTLLNGAFAMSEMSLAASRKARLAAMAEAGDKGSQAAMKLLADKIPESRYVPCASLVCPKQGGAEAPGKCRRYIEKDFERTESAKDGAQ